MEADTRKQGICFHSVTSVEAQKYVWISRAKSVLFFYPCHHSNQGCLNSGTRRFSKTRLYVMTRRHCSALLCYGTSGDVLLLLGLEKLSVFLCLPNQSTLHS